MWSIDKKLGVAYYKLDSYKLSEYECSDQEAGKDMMIDLKNNLVGFSFVFPDNWFGPNLDLLKKTIEQNFDNVVLIKNTMTVYNDNIDIKLKKINCDIIIDFNSDKILGLEFLFKPF